MESSISPTEAKEQLKSKKFGDPMRIEILHDAEKTNITDKDSNIVFDLAYEDISNIVWLLDETPQVVFAISGKINHEFDDFVTILLGFKNNKTAIISSNCVTSNKRQNCNVICTDGEISLDFLGFSFENNQKNNVQKITEVAFLSSQKGIPIYLELK
tara:strand:- start:1338 stop:1808 length:471 start_codon:yes stop_codon:yes gene_type:complete